MSIRMGIRSLTITGLLLSGPSVVLGGNEVKSIDTIDFSNTFDQYAINVGSQSLQPSCPPDAQNAADGMALHAQHKKMLTKKGYSRTEHGYNLPDLTLVSMNDERVTLQKALESDKPVFLNFIFTTCTTICPVLSATFSQVQEQLGDERDQVRMISITIDPEHDTPERLRTYAARFKAGSQWEFLTGDLDAIIATQKSFDIYRGSKMNHEPITYLHASNEAPWIRLDGIASASDVIKEYRKLVVQQ